MDRGKTQKTSLLDSRYGTDFHEEIMNLNEAHVENQKFSDKNNSTAKKSTKKSLVIQESPESEEDKSSYGKFIYNDRFHK